MILNVWIRGMSLLNSFNPALTQGKFHDFRAGVHKHSISIEWYDLVAEGAELLEVCLAFDALYLLACLLPEVD